MHSAALLVKLAKNVVVLRARRRRCLKYKTVEEVGLTDTSTFKPPDLPGDQIAADIPVWRSMILPATD
jgi:hypothetical protein